LDWQTGLIGFRSYLRLERSLSANTIEAYLHDVDMLMQVFAAEANYLRVKKMESKGLTTNIAIYKDILDVLIYEASSIVFKAGKDAIFSFAKEEQQDEVIAALSLLCKVNTVNIKDARRRIAEKLIEDNAYTF